MKGRGVGRTKRIKLNKNSRKLLIIIFFAILLIILGNTLFFGSRRSQNVEKVRHWYINEKYEAIDIYRKALLFQRWDEKSGVVTLTGRDKKTFDKIVITFKVEGYPSFVKMTRNGKLQDYDEWYQYMTSYIKK